jgi:hypothetical protein
VIKINELRIGNLISDLSDRTGFVKSLAWNKVAVKLEFSTINTDCDGVKPIPLTVDCIKKFEFFEEYSSSKGKGCFQKKFINITIADNGFYCYCGDCRRHISITLHHVHQLQNLYFALTGEELTMK